MIEIKVPGKLFIAGEYAVLEPGYPAVVIAVNRYVKATIKPSVHKVLSMPQIGCPKVIWDWKDHQVHLESDSPRLAFAKSALQVALKFIQEQGGNIKGFTLDLNSDLDDGAGKKYGLGSSAAVVVTIISGILHFHRDQNIPVEKEIIYKLSAIAHYKTQGNGSCADIAASTFGGWISYSSFEPSWLLSQLEERESISELIFKEWPNLQIQSLPVSQFFQLCIGWTKTSARTAPMVKKIQQMKTSDPSRYDRFLQESREAVEALIESIKREDIEGAIQSLTRNRLALKSLGKWTGERIETPKLSTLIEIANRYGSGKSSGAGGGDCGIALLRQPRDREDLYREWKKAGIEPLPLEVAHTGAEVCYINWKSS